MLLHHKTWKSCWRLEEPDSSFRFLSYPQVDGQIETDYSYLEETEIMYLNGRILKQTFLFGWVDCVKDEVINEVIRFCLTHSSFRYTIIRSFERFRFSVINSDLCSFCVFWMTVLMLEFWWIVEDLTFLTTYFHLMLTGFHYVINTFYSLISFREWYLISDHP